jgi:cAMP phosphodiesterase
MRVQLLPSTIDEDGRASERQHLMSIIIDDCVAVDAGCLAFSCSDLQRRQVRDIVLTHAHLDHIAGLPMYVDDLFATLTEPIRVHAIKEVIEILERDVFNWAVYPRFSELTNDNNTNVVEYHEFVRGDKIAVKHLSIDSFGVNHKVCANGYIISDGNSAVGVTGDTGECEEIWAAFNACPNLKTIMVECAFPNELVELATISDHLTPQKLESELENFNNEDCEIYVINLKPMYRADIVDQLSQIKSKRLNILEIGKVYNW